MATRTNVKVYSETGELIAEGTVAHCARAMGVTENALRSAVMYRPERHYKGFWLEAETVQKDDKPQWTTEEAAAIAKWDAFAAPIRQRYGIQVHKGGR